MNPSFPRRLRPLALLCLAGAVAGCSGSKLPTPIDGEFAAVTVFGRVLGPDGEPVPLVEVEVEARRAHACGQASGNSGSVTTGADGRFRATVGEWGTRHEVCLLVTAVPRPATGLAPDSSVRTPVLMLYPQGDSVRVDFGLKPR